MLEMASNTTIMEVTTPVEVATTAVKPKARKPRATKPKADKPKEDKPKEDKPKEDKPKVAKPKVAKPRKPRTPKKPKEEEKCCDVCVEKFTRVRRVPIKCYHENCGAIVCLGCFRQYLLMEDSDQECMVCKNPLSTEFIFMHTPKVFREEFINKTVELDLKREEQLLKSTQERMDAKVKAYGLYPKVRLLNKKLVKKKLPQEERDALVIERDALEEEIEELETLFNKSDTDISRSSTTFYCPFEKCEGLVKKGVCGACERSFCNKCKEEKKEDHVCDPELLETLKLLRRDSKPCPKCKTLIFKIDGCDQMFCVNCKTAFSWRTLTIHRGHIHNPHYFEYLRNNRQEDIERFTLFDLDDPCGRELNIALQKMLRHPDFVKFYNRDFWSLEEDNMNKSMIVTCDFIPRVLNEIEEILPILTNLVYDDQSIARKKTKLRERYILNKKEKTWKGALRLLIKKREVFKDLIKLIELFDGCLKDFVIMSGRETTENPYEVLLEETVNLHKYFLNQLKEMSTRHGLQVAANMTLSHGLRVHTGELR
nr:NTPase helicase [Iridovirus CN01]UPA43835.1 NTPase helicase [Iridovirus CN01]